LTLVVIEIPIDRAEENPRADHAQQQRAAGPHFSSQSPSKSQGIKEREIPRKRLREALEI
jgi:hypothetical protein